MGKTVDEPEAKENSGVVIEPSLFETYGTFPVWMLKAIQLATPSFLIAQKKSQETNEDASSHTA